MNGLLIAGFALLAAPSPVTPDAGEPTLAEVRALTAKYQDVKVALAEGFVRDPANMCEPPK